MTLKEKLNDSIITNINIVESENRMYYEYNHLELAEKCENIADEFSIDFAEWVRKETYYEYLTKEFIYKRNVYESEKELLEIYKKEQGL